MNEASAALQSPTSRKDISPGCSPKPDGHFTAPNAQRDTHFPNRSVQPTMRKIARILVATDFSPSCVKALERAVAVAGQSRADLTILHVIDTNANASTGTAAELMRSLWTNGAARLNEVSSSLPPELQVQTALEEGLPWEVIVEKSHDFELLILGQNNKRRRWNMFSQQTAPRVLLNSACPVLVIDGKN